MGVRKKALLNKVLNVKLCMTDSSTEVLTFFKIETIICFASCISFVAEITLQSYLQKSAVKLTAAFQKSDTSTYLHFFYVS